MAEIPRDLAPAFNPNIAFKQGSEEIRGLMKVGRERQQRKKQDQDLETLSATLGVDLKTMEAMKVMSQYKVGVSRANAGVAKATREIALNTAAAEYMGVLPKISTGKDGMAELNGLKSLSNYNEVYMHDKIFRAAVEEKEDEILFNNLGSDYVKQTEDMKTQEGLDTLVLMPKYNYIKSNFDRLSNAYERKFRELNPPIVRDVFVSNPDGTLSQIVAGRETLFSDTKSTFKPANETGPETGQIFDTEAEAIAAIDASGVGGTYEPFVDADGVTKYRVKDFKVPGRQRQPLFEFKEDTKEKSVKAALAKQSELLAQKKYAQVVIDPVTGVASIFAVGPLTSSAYDDFQAGVNASTASEMDKQNIVNLPGFKPATGLYLGNKLTTAQAKKLENGTTYEHVTLGRITK